MLTVCAKELRICFRTSKSQKCKDEKLLSFASPFVDILRCIFVRYSRKLGCSGKKFVTYLRGNLGELNGFETDFNSIYNRMLHNKLKKPTIKNETQRKPCT